MIQYIKNLIDKSKPESTVAFLIILTVITLLICSIGTLIVIFFKPVFLKALYALLSSICSLLGIQGFKEFKEKITTLIESQESNNSDDK